MTRMRSFLRTHSLLQRTDRLRFPIKPNRLDSASELLQRIDSLRSASAGIADQIVETLLSANDHEMRGPIRIPQPRNDRIFVEQVPINQEIRGQILVVGQIGAT